jgi:hypothetical protein
MKPKPCTSCAALRKKIKKLKSDNKLYRDEQKRAVKLFDEAKEREYNLAVALEDRDAEIERLMEEK